MIKEDAFAATIQHLERRVQTWEGRSIKTPKKLVCSGVVLTGTLKSSVFKEALLIWQRAIHCCVPCKTPNKKINAAVLSVWALGHFTDSTNHPTRFLWSANNLNYQEYVIGYGYVK